MPRLRLFLLIVLVVCAGSYGWWMFGQSPEQEMLAAQNNLLAAAEDRDWEEVSTLMADDFASSVGHNRETAVADAEQVLGQFLTLDLQPTLIGVVATPAEGTVKTNIHLEGTGSAIAQIVASRANAITAPWVFHWRKQGRWRWDWKLTRIDQPDLTGQLPE